MTSLLPQTALPQASRAARVAFRLWIDFPYITLCTRFTILRRFRNLLLLGSALCELDGSMASQRTIDDTRKLPKTNHRALGDFRSEKDFAASKRSSKSHLCTIGVLSRRLPRPLAAFDCRCGWWYAIVEGDRLLGELDSLSQCNRARRCRARRSSGQGAP